MRKKICLFPTIMFPVPNVKGGAIETLITNIIDENEKENKLDITVISIDDPKAKEKSKKYQNTQFIFIKPSIIDKIEVFLFRVIRKITKKEILQLYAYNVKAFKKICRQKFDYIIAEGGLYHTFKILLKTYKKNQLIAHIHHHCLSDDLIDNTFGHIITISEFVKKEWINSSKNKNNVEVLKNGIDIQKFSNKISKKEKENLRSKYDFKSNDFVILFCGRLIEVKGIKELIQAIQKIKDVKLLVVGSSNFAMKKETKFEKELKELVQLNSDRIKFTGYIDNSELYKYYQLVDLMVIPSIWEEAAGLVSIEAMASGTPLVVTRSGGLIEYVDDKTAKVIEKDDNIVKNIENSIIEIKNNPKILKKMSLAGPTRAKKFSKETYYKEFCNLINKL